MPAYNDTTGHTIRQTDDQSNTSANQLRFAIYEGLLSTYVPRPDCVYSGKQTTTPKPDCIYSRSHVNSSYDELGYSSVSDSSSANTSDSSLEKVSSDEPSLMELLDDVEDSCNYFRDILSDLSERDSPNDVTSILPEPPKQTFRNLPSIVIKKTDSPAKSSCMIPQTISCDICAETFPTLSKLKTHMSVHSKARRHVCNVCNKAFSQRTTLRTHMRVHTGERPFKCGMCPKAFADYSTCAKHERTHTGERPYVCPTCGKGFAQSGNMLRHKLTHNKQKKSKKL
ncbi:hypothetical protein FSP39_022033 [Pinctada imbricata]|uniref:C2H2-type domain-containing protein n=1 Tax=Pinctada imbricata TaxID=66713 RepID=A0AA89BRQ6_PINIB|nr:hypothetical protein FSP39_022033 [Pinctada imbricata]